MTRPIVHRYSADSTPVLYGRSSLLMRIRDYVVDREIPENIAVLGLRGAGKSSLIRKAFCKSAGRDYYEQGGVIVCGVSIPESTDNMKNFYSYLNTALLEGLDRLEEYDQDKYARLLAQIVDNKNKILSRSIEVDEAIVGSIFNKNIDIIRSAGLKLLFVFDDFEKFASSSRLKKAQYKYMRELANSGKISLFIATKQDLTNVSAEVLGSGFENIFLYEELRGIRFEDIENWASDAVAGTGIEFDDAVLEWIEDVSGGIPEIVSMAIEQCYELLSQKQSFDESTCYKKLYPVVYPLMQKWWNDTEETEGLLLKQMIEGTSVNSYSRDRLIKKGYLNERDSGEVVFSTPLFEMFVLEKMVGEEPGKNISARGGAEELRSLLREIVREANEGIEQKIENINHRIYSLGNQLSAFIEELPSRSDFYQEKDELLDLDKYQDAISSYITNKLIEIKDEEICAGWNIDKETWDSFSEIRRNDCSMAYRLTTLVFAEDIPNLDYTPVTVMLGNFLEGLLNDRLTGVVKKYTPAAKIRKREGYCRVDEYNGNMTIGAFSYIYTSENIAKKIMNDPRASALQLNLDRIESFGQKLSECMEIRNKADHPGEITTFQDKKKFLTNLFQGKNCMLRVMCKMSRLV